MAHPVGSVQRRYARRRRSWLSGTRRRQGTPCVEMSRSRRRTVHRARRAVGTARTCRCPCCTPGPAKDRTGRAPTRRTVLRDRGSAHRCPVQHTGGTRRTRAGRYTPSRAGGVEHTSRRRIRVRSHSCEYMPPRGPAGPPRKFRRRPRGLSARSVFPCTANCRGTPRRPPVDRPADNKPQRRSPSRSTPRRSLRSGSATKSSCPFPAPPFHSGILPRTPRRTLPRRRSSIGEGRANSARFVCKRRLPIVRTPCRSSRVRMRPKRFWRVRSRPPARPHHRTRPACHRHRCPTRHPGHDRFHRRRFLASRRRYGRSHRRPCPAGRRRRPTRLREVPSARRTLPSPNTLR
jgi:hypothetical protein